VLVPVLDQQPTQLRLTLAVQDVNISRSEVAQEQRAPRERRQASCIPWMRPIAAPFFATRAAI